MDIPLDRLFEYGDNYFGSIAVEQIFISCDVIACLVDARSLSFSVTLLESRLYLFVVIFWIFDGAMAPENICLDCVFIFSIFLFVDDLRKMLSSYLVIVGP